MIAVFFFLTDAELLIKLISEGKKEQLIEQAWRKEGIKEQAHVKRQFNVQKQRMSWPSRRFWMEGTVRSKCRTVRREGSGGKLKSCRRKKRHQRKNVPRCRLFLK